MEKEIINFLLIDDSESDLELLKYRISKNFPKAIIVTAKGKADFLEKIDWVEPDMILCDYDLKDGNGLEILLINRQQWNVPFIFVTGTLKSGSKFGEAILKGAEDYILKDNLEDLPHAIHRVILTTRKKQQAIHEQEHALNSIDLEIEKLQNVANESDVKSKVNKCLNQIRTELKNVRNSIATYS